jgi:hypothetical protein
MPYISARDRRRYEELELSLEEAGGIDSEGELNYLITMMVNAYLGSSPHYADYNGVVGVLECAKLELYRRRVALYEDVKAAENGDVYP